MGSIGDAAGHSFTQEKFSALGDAGAVTTNDETLGKLLRHCVTMGPIKIRKHIQRFEF
jgi:dTDP-4-amino-4,6-dideoxygalactose transaminase